MERYLGNFFYVTTTIHCDGDYSSLSMVYSSVQVTKTMGTKNASIVTAVYLWLNLVQFCALLIHSGSKVHFSGSLFLLLSERMHSDSKNNIKYRRSVATIKCVVRSYIPMRGSFLCKLQGLVPHRDLVCEFSVQQTRPRCHTLWLNDATVILKKIRKREQGSKVVLITAT